MLEYYFPIGERQAYFQGRSHVSFREGNDKPTDIFFIF